ncbi:MAG TPA: ABC transporter ATP-binding protein, partial [Desulfobacteraceae bacterium]|nr:ABC transporter ATP-binding protein [Desulfobacteraceae bacterium]
RQRLAEISGMVPGLLSMPPGCAFHPRCRQAMTVCRDRVPVLIESEEGHSVRCWLYGPGAATPDGQEG